MARPLERIAARQRRSPARDALFGLFAAALMIFMLTSLSVVSNLAWANNDAITPPAQHSTADEIEHHVAERCGDLPTQPTPPLEVLPC